MTTTGPARDKALHADICRPSRREQIQHAAAQLFAERGSRAVGVDDVGAAVDVTGPAIYWHFAGKNAMFAEMLLRISERLRAGGSERVPAAGADPAHQLKALINGRTEIAPRVAPTGVRHRLRRGARAC